MTVPVALPRPAAPLTGPQRVAVLYMALGAEAAAKITRHLSREEVEAISFEIARTEQAPGEVVDAVLTEWVESMLGAGSLAAGGLGYARDVLEQALGAERAAAVLARVGEQLQGAERLSQLRRADPQQLGTMLRGEHPQAVALILAHLEPAHGAAVLRELEPAAGSDVVYRMARMDKVAPEMLQLIERTLAIETDLAVIPGEPSGGPGAVAAMLNHVAFSLERELLDGVADRDPTLCEQIQQLMFVFEDIVRLDDRTVQRLLREIDTRELALALKSASEPLKAKITGSMAQRAVTALQEEIELLGPVRVRDVQEAQARIVGQLRRLEEAGEIALHGGADDVVIS